MSNINLNGLNIQLRKVYLFVETINLADADQCEWARTYLINHGLANDDHQRMSAAECIKRLCNDLPDPATPDGIAFKLFDKTMRSSWLKQKGRLKSPKRRPHTLAISKQAVAELRRLAGDEPLDKTLEKLILDQSQFRSQLERQAAERIKDIKAAAERQKQNYPNARKMQYLNLKVMELEKAILDGNEVLNSVMLLSCRYLVELRSREVLLKNYELEMDPRKEALANTFFRRWQRALHAQIGARLTIRSILKRKQQLGPDLPG